MAKQLAQPPKGNKIESDSEAFDTITHRLAEIRTLADVARCVSSIVISGHAPLHDESLQELNDLIIRLTGEAEAAAHKVWEQYSHARKIANGEVSHG